MRCIHHDNFRVESLQIPIAIMCIREFAVESLQIPIAIM